MKIILSRMVSVLLLLVFILGSMKILNYCLVDDAASYTRLMEHELYNQDNIDLLFVGPSHCYWGIDPEVIREQTGKNAFLASSSSQNPDGSLALIREALSLYDVEEVFLELSATKAQSTGDVADRDSMVSTYMISDYMRPSLNKYLFMLHASRSEFYINGFFPARRNWSQILDFPYIRETLSKKNTDVYTSYRYDFTVTEEDCYTGKGHVVSNRAIEDHCYNTKVQREHNDISAISEDWKRTVRDIIRYCRQKNVKLTLINLPVSAFLLSAQGDFDEYIDFVRGFVKEEDAEYIDFNLLRKEYFPYVQSWYKDEDHLNMAGSEAFSAFLARFCQGEIPEEAYYSSVEEKLADLEPDYYGIEYRNHKDKGYRRIQLVSNQPGVFEYKVEIQTKDGTSLIQDFDTNYELQIPLEQLKKDKKTKTKPEIVVTFRKAGTEEAGTRIVY